MVAGIVVVDMESVLFRAVLLYHEESANIERPHPDWTVSVTELRRRSGSAKLRLTATHNVTKQVLQWPEDESEILAIIPERYLPPFILNQRVVPNTQDVLPL